MDDKDIDSLWLIVLKDYALDRHFCFYMMCEDKTLEPLLKMLSGKKIDSVEINAYKRSRAVSQVEKDEYFCDIYTGYTEILSAADMTFGINLEKYLL